MWIKEILKNILINHIDDSIVVMCTLLVIGIAILISLKKDKLRWYSSAPSIITTIGIASTFLGVSYGLLSFNGVNLDGINHLIQGLRVAFFPSLVAIIISIAFRFKNVQLQSKTQHMTSISEQLQQHNMILEKYIEVLLLLNPEIKSKMEQDGQTKIDEESVKQSVASSSWILTSKAEHIFLVLLYKPDSWKDPVLLIKTKNYTTGKLVLNAATINHIPIIDYPELARSTYEIGQVGQLLPEDVLVKINNHIEQHVS